jgi:hypothetical protein
VTRASASDTKHLLPLVEEVKKKHWEIYRDIDRAAADKGYDSEENCRRLYGVLPVSLRSVDWLPWVRVKDGRLGNSTVRLVSWLRAGNSMVASV